MPRRADATCGAKWIRSRRFSTVLNGDGEKSPTTVGLLAVVVENEFVRMRAQADGANFFRSFVLDEGFEQIGGEDAAFQQEVVVGFQGIESFVELANGHLHLVDVLFFKQIDLGWLAGIDLVLDAVETSHEHGGESQVGIGGGIGAAEFDALGFG